MAHTLLLSYRLTSAQPLPFAIITDRHNRYTEDFDDVVILEDAQRSYMDKLALLTHAPYDENIFIDADCIAFGDLNRYWDSFRDADDFSCYGFTLPVDQPNDWCWFTREGAGRYGDQIGNLLCFHGGLYFIRPGEKCRQIQRVAQDIAEHYSEFKFWMFKRPADEPVLALAMTVCGCVPVPRVPWAMVLYNFNVYPELDFFRRRLVYRKKDAPNAQPCECLVLHYGSIQFDCPDYLREARKVQFEAKHHRAWTPLEEKLNVALCQVLYVLIHSAREILRFFRKTLRKLRRH